MSASCQTGDRQKHGTLPPLPCGSRGVRSAHATDTGRVIPAHYPSHPRHYRAARSFICFGWLLCPSPAFLVFLLLISRLPVTKKLTGGGAGGGWLIGTQMGPGPSTPSAAPRGDWQEGNRSLFPAVFPHGLARERRSCDWQKSRKLDYGRLGRESAGEGRFWFTSTEVTNTTIFGYCFCLLRLI